MPCPALPGLGHSFRLDATSQTPRQVWLRLQTSSAHWLNAELMPMDQVAQTSSRQLIWSALYAAVLLLVFFVLLAIWWGQRDQVPGAYLLRHALYTWYGDFGADGMTGFTPPSTWPRSAPAT